MLSIRGSQAARIVVQSAMIPPNPAAQL